MEIDLSLNPLNFRSIILAQIFFFHLNISIYGAGLKPCLQKISDVKIHIELDMRNLIDHKLRWFEKSS